MKPNVLSDNAYEVLGVPTGASPAAIKAAYARLVLLYHPDVVVPECRQAAERFFAKINSAYGVLSQAENRRRYDAWLERGIFPPLEQDLGGVTLPKLEDILGQLQTLNLPPLDTKPFLADLERYLIT